MRLTSCWSVQIGLCLHGEGERGIEKGGVGLQVVRGDKRESSCPFNGRLCGVAKSGVGGNFCSTLL